MSKSYLHFIGTHKFTKTAISRYEFMHTQAWHSFYIVVTLYMLTSYEILLLLIALGAAY